jgi:hypothetical protein
VVTVPFFGVVVVDGVVVATGAAEVVTAAVLVAAGAAVLDAIELGTVIVTPTEAQSATAT